MNYETRNIIRQAHLGHVDGAQIVVEDAIPGKRIKPGRGSVVRDDMYGYLIFLFDDDTWAAWEPDAYGEEVIYFRENRLEPAALHYAQLLTDDEYKTYQNNTKGTQQ